MKLQKKTNKGISIGHMRIWALVFVAAGIAGISVFLRGILGVSEATDTETMKLLFESAASKTYIMVYVICQAFYACAVPLFALMLVEGARHTRDISKYLVRVFLVALISEVPFDFATGSKWLDLNSLNPVFGAGIALVMLYFFSRYEDEEAGAFVLRVVIAAAAALWCIMFNVEEGICIVLVTAVMWTFWENTKWRTILGCVACLVPIAFGLFYYAISPLAMLLTHFYNGEKGPDMKGMRLVAFPAIALIAGLLRLYLF